MAEARINGTTLYYIDSAPTDRGRPSVLFSHGLLMSSAMFEQQAAALADRYRVVRYDHRGQGQSADDGRRSIDMDTLSLDAVALIEKLGLAPVHFAGLSMGGFVGLRLASRRPGLLSSLSLLDTAAGPEPRENLPKFRAMSLAARLFGVRALVDRVMPILFGRTFMSDAAHAAARTEWRERLAANRRSVWRAVAGVLDRPSIEHELSRIRVPTLVMVGEEDTATPPPRAEQIAQGIAGARLVRIPKAGHSSTVENPDAVSAELSAFLDELPAPSSNQRPSARVGLS
jgi:pimeloyl-ACP methyl ester carboxylesterase